MSTAAYRIALPPRWRTPAIVAGSVLAHVLALGALGYRHFDREVWRAPEPPPLMITLEPRPMLRNETPRPSAALAPRLIETQPNLSPTSPVTRDRPLDEEDENAPDPRVARGVPGAPTAGSENPWTYRPETMSGAVARSLRGSPIGCDMRNGRMSAAEQQLCDERFNERAGRARPLTGSGNRERDAEFARQGAAAIDRYERRRRPLAGGTGVVGPGDCPGSNFGTGCSGAHLDPSLRPDSSENIRTPQREGPR